MLLKIRRSGSLLAFSLLLTLFWFPSCQVPDYLYYNVADLHDYRIFPSVDIPSSPAASGIPEARMRPALVVPDTFCEPGKPVSLPEFLEERKTVAFAILHDDSLVMEEYFSGYSRSSVLPAFSIAKSYVSALTGIALEEGYIRSLEQPVTDFLPDLKDPRFREVTLKNLLEMRSGIRFGENYLDPFGEMARLYYTDHLARMTLDLRVDSAADQHYVYQSANTELLGMALERATGRSLAEYLGEKIWIPAGMTPGATWSVDNDRNPQIKAFCCINATLPDFEKFGLLFLNRGTWHGDTIIPPAWVDASHLIRNDSRDSQGYPYCYAWRSLPSGEYFAKGVNGQFIFISPARHLVIVRFGKGMAGFPWVEFFRRLSLQF